MLNPSKEEIRAEMRQTMYRYALHAKKPDGTFRLTIAEYSAAIRTISLKNEPPI